MKVFNQLLWLVFGFCLLGISACTKENLPAGMHTNNGIITGFDARTCPTCGGLMITFSTDPKPYSADFRLIANDPQNLAISETAAFPIYVNVDWKEDSAYAGKRIRITRLSRR